MNQKDNGNWYENPGGIVQSNEWYTPPEVFTALKVNLKKDWFGFVWCNPPYGKDTGLWLKKFIEHGNGIALVFSRTDTRWFHDYATKADILCFTKGRLAFYRPNAVDQYVQAKQGSTGSLLLGCGDKAIQSIKQANLGYNVHKR